MLRYIPLILFFCSALIAQQAPDSLVASVREGSGDTKAPSDIIRSTSSPSQPATVQPSLDGGGAVVYHRPTTQELEADTTRLGFGWTAGERSLLRYLPRPYLESGIFLMGGGYAPVAYGATGGITADAPHFILDAKATYDNGRKEDDGTQPNPKGHDRYLEGSAYYRFSSGWFAGGGFGWNQLMTTNYTKSGSRPSFGFGKDYYHYDYCKPSECHRDLSFRLRIDYVTSGSDWQNGSQGPRISLYIPSPSEKRHWFMRESLLLYRFHDTVTDPADPVLTSIERSHHAMSSSADFTIMYRF